MSITSAKNKDMLKGFLLEHPLLKLNEDEFNLIFEKEVMRLHQNRFSYRSNLVQMNKELLKTFQKIGIDVKKREDERVRQQERQQERQSQSVHQQFVNKRNQEKQRERSAINFEQRLNNTKSEFDKVMAGKRPEEIDFADKVQDSPINSNQVDLTMSKRQAELSAIMKQQTKNKNVEQWLQGDTNEKPPNSEINIKIDHTSNVPVNLDPIPAKSILKKKITGEPTNRHVRFQKDNGNNIKPQGTTEVDFFQKLKLKNEASAVSNMFNNEIKDILKTICDNQTTIIQELKTMNNRFLENMERNNKINKVENKVSDIVEDGYEDI